MRVYIVEYPDGEWVERTSTPWKEFTHRAPKVKDGMVTLDGLPYVIDPRLMRRETYRNWRSLKLIPHEMTLCLWQWNNPAPIPFFNEPLPNGIAGETIATYAASQHLKRLVQPDMNWYAIIAIVAVLGLIGAIVALYAQR